MNKWQFITVVAVALVAGLIGGVISDRVAKATGKKVIEAEEFRVVDKAGKVRASLNADEVASALILYDANGEPRATIGVIKHKSLLALYDVNSKQRANIGADNDSSTLSFFDDNGKPRAIIGAIKNNPAVELYDAEGDRRAALGAANLVGPKTSTAMNRSESSLVLFNKKGDVLWAAP
jgi:hypothetical protein